jgi:hypothetical protein
MFRRAVLLLLDTRIAERCEGVVNGAWARREG